MTAKNHIFLMYCGRSPDGKEYRRWKTDEITPVLHYNKDETSDSFFPSVLLLAIKSGNGNCLIPGFGIPGDKKDWLSWMDDIYLQDSNLVAVAKTVKELGLPRVDIWISLPYPDPAQKQFGLVFNRNLNFNSNSDRAMALEWWIRRFLGKWDEKINAAGFEKNIWLRGFYWARESMTPKDRLLLPSVISCIHSRGFLSLWIPYFVVTAFMPLFNPGFDITIIQPSYMQNAALGWQRLSAAARRAKKYKAGIEIEFDGGALHQNSTAFTSALDYLNRGLPQFDGYIQNTPIAYYTGYKTVVQLHKNNSPLYTYLYRFVKGDLTKITYNGISY